MRYFRGRNVKVTSDTGPKLFSKAILEKHFFVTSWDSCARIENLRTPSVGETEKEIVEISRGYRSWQHKRRSPSTIEQKHSEEWGCQRDKVASSCRRRKIVRDQAIAASSNASFTDHTIFFIRGYLNDGVSARKSSEIGPLRHRRVFLVTQGTPFAILCWGLKMHRYFYPDGSSYVAT